VADPTLARPEGADADPATAATRPAKPPRVLPQMPVDVRSVSLMVLAWGWLWGVPGLLLGVPILVVIKSICDRVDDLKPVGEFLSA